MMSIDMSDFPMPGGGKHRRSVFVYSGPLEEVFPGYRSVDFNGGTYWVNSNAEEVFRRSAGRCLLDDNEMPLGIKIVDHAEGIVRPLRSTEKLAELLGYPLK